MCLISTIIPGVRDHTVSQSALLIEKHNRLRKEEESKEIRQQEETTNTQQSDIGLSSLFNSPILSLTNASLSATGTKEPENVAVPKAVAPTLLEQTFEKLIGNSKKGAKRVKNSGK